MRLGTAEFLCGGLQDNRLFFAHAAIRRRRYLQLTPSKLTLWIAKTRGF